MGGPQLTSGPKTQLLLGVTSAQLPQQVQLASLTLAIIVASRCCFENVNSLCITQSCTVQSTPLSAPVEAPAVLTCRAKQASAKSSFKDCQVTSR